MTNNELKDKLTRAVASGDLARIQAISDSIPSDPETSADEAPSGSSDPE